VGPQDLVIVSEAPVLGRGMSLQQYHVPYADDAGRIVAKTVELARASAPAMQKLRIGRTYSVLCSGADPAQGVRTRCEAFLHSALQLGNPVILAMGLNAAKSVGVKAARLADVQHRVMQGVQLHGKTYTVVVTVSAKQLVSMPGLYDNFKNDVLRAMKLASHEEETRVPLAELTKDYVYPKTLLEVEQLCNKIIGYAEDGKDPASWFIAADSETNTLFPHRKKLKMVAVSFAWGIGKACAIPLFHAETPYDPEAALEHVRRVLESLKPKVFHNGKYDTKVFARYGIRVANWIWDTLLAEHALAEDKKGQYGLKPLTSVRFPQFSGYADRLHELLLKEEGESLLGALQKAKAAEVDSELQAAAATIQAAQGQLEITVTKTRKKKAVSKKALRKMDGGFERLPLTDLLPYAAIDTDITRRLAVDQTVRMLEEERAIAAKKAMAQRDTRRLFPVPNLCMTPNPTREIVRTRSVPLAGVLGRMELGGVPVDRPYLHSLQDTLGTVITNAETALLAMANRPGLKLNSAKEIADVLFHSGYVHPDTGLLTAYSPITHTAKGQAQTTEKVLKVLVAKHGCAFSAKKLIYSKAYKAKNTFCVSVDELSAEDGMVHSNFNQHGTGTYRLSSNDINLQNIPKKLSGHSIKKIFITDDPDSMVFVNADAKGAEVRILTAYSRDGALIQSLNDGQDTHSFIASKIVMVVRLSPGAAKALASMGLDDSFPLTYEDFAARDDWKVQNPKYGEMLDKFRTAVKRVVFGILYGAGAAKIAETIGISKEQATLIIEMLFKMFPSIPRYMEQTRWELRTFGMVETFFGHRRRFNVQGAAKFLVSRAERQGVNFKIQSTSSDIVLDCLQRVEQPLARDLGGRLLLTVHDSIGFQLPKKYLTQLPDFVEEYLVKETARRFPWLPVAFAWDYEVGPSYGELSPLKQYLANNPIPEEYSDVKEAYTEEEIRIELADLFVG